MFKDLISVLALKEKKDKVQDKTQENISISKNTSIDAHTDTQIACNLVDILFKHVMTSIQTDRSSVKLNVFTKGMIGGVLGRTRDGTKEYVVGMFDSDIKLLLNDIEIELVRRKMDTKKGMMK